MQNNKPVELNKTDTNAVPNIGIQAQTYLAIEQNATTNNSVLDTAAQLNLTLGQKMAQTTKAAVASTQTSYIANTSANAAGATTTQTIYAIKQDLATKLLLTPEQIAAIEGYATNNDLAGLRTYLSDLLKTYNQNAASTATSATMKTKYKNAAGLLTQLLGLSSADIRTTLCTAQTTTVTPPVTPTPTPTPTPVTPPTTTPAAPTLYVAQRFVDSLFLTVDQKKKLEDLIKNNDLSGIRTYLGEIKQYLQNQLASASTTVKTNLNNAIGLVDQLIAASDTTLTQTLFSTTPSTGGIVTTTPTTPTTPTPPTAPTTPTTPTTPSTPVTPIDTDTPSPIYDIGSIIDADTTAALTSLEDDSSFYEPFYAEVVTSKFDSRIYLTPDQKLQLEQLANSGDDTKLKAYLQQLITELTNLKTELSKNNTGQNTAAINKISNTIGLFQQLLALPGEEIHKQFFEKKLTGFWIFKADAFEQIADRIKTKMNILGLLTQLVHAEMDSANMITQIMTEQTGYQKMNIEKINTKQSESVNNFINTRKKEIATRVNTHNTIEKTKIDQQTAQQKEQDHGNLFLNLLAGIVTFIASILATIFSAGIAAPVVVSIVATTFETIIAYRKYMDEATQKKELEKLEETMSLLRAAEEHEQRKTLERRKEQLQQALNTTTNAAYKELLELELGTVTTTLATNTLISQDNTSTETFAVNEYMRSALTVQGMLSLYRIYIQIKLEGYQARNRIAEELSLPATYAPTQIPESIQNNLSQLFEMATTISNLQFQRSQILEQIKSIKSEIKNNEISFIFSTLGSVISTVLNICTFNMGGTFLKALVTSTTKPAFTFIASLLALNNTTDEIPNNTITASPTLLTTAYASILSDTTDLTRTSSKQKHALSYTELLQRMQQLDTLARQTVLEQEIIKSLHESRASIHQTLTDISAQSSSMSATATANTQQYNAIMKDGLQKQASLIQQQTTQYNQRAEAFNTMVRSGLSVGLSALTGFLSGSASSLFKVGRNREGFLFSLGGFFLNNEEQDLYDLLTDSDLYNKIEDSYYPYPTSNGSDGSSDQHDGQQKSPWVLTTEDGNTTVNIAQLQRTYTTMTRKLALEEALTAIAKARHTARNLIHMEMAQQAAPSANLSAQMTGLTVQGAQEQFATFSEQLSTTADLLSRRNTRLKAMEQNLLTTLISIGTSQVALVSGVSFSEAQTTLEITKALLSASVTIMNILDNSFDATVARLKSNTQQSTLITDHAQRSVEEQEQLLLNEALKLKNNTGTQGLLGANLVQLEYIAIVLNKIKAIKELQQKIIEEVQSSRDDIHSTLTAIAGDTNTLAQEIGTLISQYMQTLLQTYKQLHTDTVQRQNQRTLRNYEAALQIADQALSVARSVTGLLDSDTQATARMITDSLSDVLPIIRLAAYVQPGKRNIDTVSTENLTASEAEALAGATLDADVQLLQAQESFLQYNTTLMQQAIEATRKILQRALTTAIMQNRLHELFRQAQFEKQNSQMQTAKTTLTKTSQEILQRFELLKTNAYYTSHIAQAHQAAIAGEYSKALQFLDTRLNTAFYTTVNDFTPENQASITALRQSLVQASQTTQEIQEINVVLQNIAQTTAQGIINIPAAIKQLNTDYKKLTALQQEYTAAQNFCIAEAIPAETLYELLSASDSTFINKIAPSSPEMRQAIQVLRTYQSQYKALIPSALLLITLQTNQQAFEKVMQDYTLAQMDISGTVPDITQALITANALCAGYAPLSVQAKKFGSIENTLTIWQTYIASLPPTEQAEKRKELAGLVLNMSLTQGVPAMPLAETDLDKTTQSYEETSTWLQRIPEKYAPVIQSPEQAWTGFFAAQKKSEDPQALELNKRYTTATQDLTILEKLFQENAETTPVPFMSSTLSPELKVYLSQLSGNNAVLHPALRQSILSYVTRKRENCEIDLLKLSADTGYGRSINNEAFLNAEKLEHEYATTCLEYETVARQNPTDQRLKDLSSKLNTLKYKLDTIEAGISRRNQR